MAPLIYMPASVEVGAAVSDNFLTNSFSISLDGVDEDGNVVGYKVLSGSAARSVIVWAKIAAISSGHERLLTWGNNLNETRCLFRSGVIGGADGGGTALRMDFGGAVQEGRTDIDDNQWHMLSYSYPSGGNATATKLYVDGVEETKQTETSSTVNTGSTFDLYIGSENGATNLFGNLDECAVFDIDLTSDEMLEIYAGGQAGFDLNTDFGDYASSGNLLVWHRFEEGSGTSVTDSSGNGRTLTLNNTEDGDFDSDVAT